MKNPIEDIADRQRWSEEEKERSLASPASSCSPFPLITGECGGLWCVWARNGEAGSFLYGFSMSEKKTVEDLVNALNEFQANSSVE